MGELVALQTGGLSERFAALFAFVPVRAHDGTDKPGTERPGGGPRMGAVVLVQNKQMVCGPKHASMRYNVSCTPYCRAFVGGHVCTKD